MTRDGPARFRHLAHKIARALAQVLWLRPRVLRERGLDTAIRLEARLLTAVELQQILWVKRHFVCKRWTIERAGESSSDTPWSGKRKLNSDRSRSRLRSLPWLGFFV